MTSRSIVFAACLAGLSQTAIAQTTSGPAFSIDANAGGVSRDCSFRVVAEPGQTITARAFRVGCVVAQIDLEAARQHVSLRRR